MAAADRKLASRHLPPVRVERRISLADVVRRLVENGRPCDEDLLKTAHELSARMHADQVRRSGEPFIVHPLYVAYILADLRFDETCVLVGLLHDLMEDTLTTREALADQFGEEVAELVDGVTKIGRHSYVRQDEAQAETFRKLILASARDVRVIVVKLADRLHNMLTLEHLPLEARRRVAQETLAIYAPIANRLGMSKVQGELEDLAFYHLYNHQFNALKERIEEKLKVAKGATRRLRDRLVKSLEETGLDAEISSRVKRYYSIHRKMLRQGIDLSQLYDYLAFRIIVGSVRDCYAALGVVHQSWRPLPGRFKDYIAMPKPNLYQALHTTVLGDQGQPFEVQIRTREMDLVAEEGIAAHWRYKEGTATPETDPNILWLRQVMEWQKEVKDPRAFLSALKIDLYPDEVYVFTPKGDVLSFPRGATSLDFAYRVHTELGHRCVGARVNGRLVPLKTALRNGDIVEVLTSPSRTPSQDWLNFVVTSRAKSKIRHYLSTEQKVQAVEIGRRLLERELRRLKVGAKKVWESAELARYLEEEGMARLEDLQSRIGFGKLTARAVLARVLGAERLEVPEQKPSRLRQAVSRILPFGDSPIVVKGHGDMLAFLAKCCNPLPGEEIVGYVTRGRGVSVHSADCANVRKLFYNPEREIEVEWAREGGDVYPVALAIETENQPGILARMTEVIANQGSNIRQIEAETEPDRGLVVVVVEVKNSRHLEKLLQGIRGVRGVLQVDRRMGADRTSSRPLVS